MILVGWVVCDYLIVQAMPSDAGFADFDTGDASSGETGPPDPLFTVVKRMVTNPVILTIAAIEFCSGFLRNAIMHWYRDFAKGAGITEYNFVYEHWGMLLCIAGIMGGMMAGIISDKVFQSRRGPVSAVLYGMMLVGALLIIPVMQNPLWVGPIVIFMSMAVIGVHGMLSGTASADFGGKRNAGVAVGLIDACVYFGTMTQSFMLGRMLPEKGTVEAADLANWTVWPWAMVPFALIGLLLSFSVWNAKPKPKGRQDEAAA
jgi:OPA family glycerol-3-phosphate transporter-like MFS transporter